MLQLIEPQALEAFLRGVAQWLTQATGKTLRGSQKAGKAIHLLNAWADKTRLVIGQRLVDGKSNEIVALPQLLESLFLDGCVVTVDALNTQTAIAQKIVDKGASRPPDLEQVEKDHGRLETRRCWVTPELSLFLEKDKWPKLQTLVRIDRTRYFADGHETTESALFLSSLPADAPTIANAVRRHWSVENQCHWLLDVVFREDACRARSRNAAQNLSVLRVCLLNLLRHHKTPSDSFRRMIMRAALDPDYLEFLLNLQQN